MLIYLFRFICASGGRPVSQSHAAAHLITLCGGPVMLNSQLHCSSLLAFLSAWVRVWALSLTEWHASWAVIVTFLLYVINEVWRDIVWHLLLAFFVSIWFDWKKNKPIKQLTQLIMLFMFPNNWNSTASCLFNESFEKTHKLNSPRSN